ncbi:MAG: polysaccharide biosynthesis protein [Chloroflexota bacterium]|nr:polysaccharide biosynthesis protein [Chloroflexota bacterium]
MLLAGGTLGVGARLRPTPRTAGRLLAPSALGDLGQWPEWAARPRHRKLRGNGTTQERTLVVGAGGGGRLLVREMRDNPSWGFHPVAFVDDRWRQTGIRVAGLPLLGQTAHIPAIVQREGIEVVVIAIPSADGVTMTRIAACARQSSARVLAMPHIGALLRGEATPATLRRIDIGEVLGRPAIVPDIERCQRFLAGKRILVTGAAGLIGLEVTRQIAQLDPAQIVGVDINESGLFDLQQDLRSLLDLDFQPVIASVTNRRRMEAVFARYRPDVVFHAAAYKHVPLMEEHPDEAVVTNAVGTYNVARAAAAAGVRRFVLVSTDKAVRPANVMGATKRVAELAVKTVTHETGLSACCVRFGNVLGSRGSVVPTFERQIDAGGPVTVTHPEMRRFFMTIPEAAHLIIQAGAFGDGDAIYMLDMGEEVPIVELAERMIRLRGLRVGHDIDIVFSGLRPGEKLREELALDTEVAQPTAHPKIHRLVEPARCLLKMAMMMPAALQQLERTTEDGTIDAVRALLFGLITAGESDPGQPLLVEAAELAL